MTDGMTPERMAHELSQGYASGLFTTEAIALMVARRTDGSVRRDWVREVLLKGDEGRAVAFAHRMDQMVGGGLALSRAWGLIPGESWRLTEEGEHAADALWELYEYLETVEPRAVLS